MQIGACFSEDSFSGFLAGSWFSEEERHCEVSSSGNSSPSWRMSLNSAKRQKCQKMQTVESKTLDGGRALNWDNGCPSWNLFSEPFGLLKLPLEVLVLVMAKLDSFSLAGLELAARSFRIHHPIAGLRLTELAAKDALCKLVGGCLEGCWRSSTWKELLYLEESAAGFQCDLGIEEGFTFACDPKTAVVKEVKLTGLGPKMLVSEASTGDQPALRWKLRVQGNTAVEFGAVPTSLQKRRKALHKCLTETNNVLSVGFCSQITVGSQLPFRVPVVKGTIIEVLVRPGRAIFTVTNPTDGLDTRWENNHRVHTEYRGPSEIKFVQEFNSDFEVKLAMTAWAKASFDVLHSRIRCSPFIVSQSATPPETETQDTKMSTC